MDALLHLVQFAGLAGASISRSSISFLEVVEDDEVLI